MKTFLKYFLYLTIAVVLLSLDTNLIIYGGLIYLAYFVGKKVLVRVKQHNANKELIAAKKAKSETIEYKMENLLKMTGDYIDSPGVRQAYRAKTNLSLQDKWYRFLDLRAKLELNNTSTSQAEAVLHVMCDEILNRIQTVDVELTDQVKKEFISENLTPLLDDVNEILTGLKPTDAIDINAYELLKNYNLKF